MKKGFTVVELIVSFSLVMVIVIFLFQIVISLKNLYTNSGVKTELLNKQSLISNEINKKLNNNEIISLTKCGPYCVEFLYLDNTSDQLIVDYNNNTIQFGNYKTDLPSQSYIRDAKISKANSATLQPYFNNALLIIEIPIYNDNFEDQNFGVKVIYQYNDQLSNFPIVDLTA